MTDVLVIGPFPPPIHGQALATEIFVRKLKSSRFHITTCDTSGRPAARAILHLKAAFLLAFSRKTTYISVNSNNGIWLTSALALLSRILNLRVYFHHHSYAIISSTSFSHKTFVKLSGEQTTHILLSHKMESEFISEFGDNFNTVVLNNAGLIAPGRKSADQNRGKLRLGFLGNVTIEKGIDSAIDTAIKCSRVGLLDKFIVAGPTMSEPVALELKRASTELGGKFQYLGRVDGTAKKNFLGDIDVLLFPSIYRNEASPLVVFEALSHGVPVISTPTGSLIDDIGELGGKVVTGIFSDQALEELVKIAHDLGSYRARARTQYENKYSEHVSQINSLIDSMRNANSK